MISGLASKNIYYALGIPLTALVFLTALGGLLIYVINEGMDHLSWAFLSELPRDAGKSGGILPVLISTGILIFASILLAVPIAILLSLYLLADGGNARLKSLIRHLGNVLASLPTIVMGLFGLILFGEILQLGYSLLSGILTLTLMLLPTLVLSFSPVLNITHNRYSLAGRALGLSQWRYLLQIVIPVSMPGILNGVILGASRALAETAALLFTAGYSMRIPESVFDSGRSLSVHIYDLSMNVPGGDKAAFASASILVFILMAFSLLARYLANPRGENEL